MVSMRAPGPTQSVDIHATPSGSPVNATNFLAGDADVLAAKRRRGQLEHLGGRLKVGLYQNDREIHEVRYR